MQLDHNDNSKRGRIEPDSALFEEAVGLVPISYSISRLDGASAEVERQIEEVHIMLQSCMLDEQAEELPHDGFLHEVYPKDFYRDLAQETSHFLVARNSDGAIIGVLMAREEPRDGSISDNWYHSSSYEPPLVVASSDIPGVVFVRYYEIAVHPDHRRSGVGSALLAAFERDFAERSEPIVAFADVIVGFDGEFTPNHASLRFHTEHGYQLGPGWHYLEDSTFIQGIEHPNWYSTCPLGNEDNLGTEKQTSHTSVSYLTFVKVLNPGYVLTESSAGYQVVSRGDSSFEVSEIDPFPEG